MNNIPRLTDKEAARWLQDGIPCQNITLRGTLRRYQENEARMKGAMAIELRDHLLEWATVQQLLADEKYRTAVQKWGNSNLSNALFARSIALTQVISILRGEFPGTTWPTIKEDPTDPFSATCM